MKEAMEFFYQNHRLMGLGEIGLDYSTDQSKLRVQREFLRETLSEFSSSLAEKCLVLHLRNSFQDKNQKIPYVHEDAMEIIIIVIMYTFRTHFRQLLNASK